MVPQIIEALLHNDFISAQKFLEESLQERIQQKLLEMKRSLAPTLVENSKNVLELGRTKVVRVRIRNGKIQRRKKLSDMPGYIMRNGRLTRMSVAEKQHRKLGARRAKIKKRSEKSQINRKRKKSLQRRKALGL